MAIILPTFQSEPSSEYSILLGLVSIRIRLAWRDRTSSWYLSVFAQDETPIILGRRLLPGQDSIVRGVTGLPNGNIRCFGTYPYARQDLGVSLGLVYVTEAELQILEAQPITDKVALI